MGDDREGGEKGAEIFSSCARVHASAMVLDMGKKRMEFRWKFKANWKVPQIGTQVTPRGRIGPVGT